MSLLFLSILIFFQMPFWAYIPMVFPLFCDFKIWYIKVLLYSHLLPVFTRTVFDLWNSKMKICLIQSLWYNVFLYQCEWIIMIQFIICILTDILYIYFFQFCSEQWWCVYCRWNPGGIRALWGIVLGIPDAW